VKLAVTAWDLSSPAALRDIPRQAATAERMGFSGFWLPENHFSGSAALSAPLILLAGAAARTQSIDVGTTSLVLPIRHPVAVAEEVATLDQLAEGRLILGLGRGFSDDLFQVFSVDPSQKRAMFKQSLSTMISAWAGERLPGAGPRDIRLSPRPFQNPNPRLWIAAFGPLALKQAAAFGCPYLASPMESLSALQENRVRYHEALDAAEQPRPEVVPIMRTIFITENSRLAEQIKQVLIDEMNNRGSLGREDDPAFIVGSASYVADTLAKYQATLGMNYLIARGRIRGLSETDQLASHDALLQLSL